jgi:hypothetical protein
VTVTASDWTLFETDADTRDRAGLGDVAWPVRTAVVDEVTRPVIDVIRLVEEADRWCDEHPDGGAALNDGIARLAWMAAIDALDDHLWDEAVHVCSIGLRHAPHNISLWSHLALARNGRGDTEAALDAFAQAIVESTRVEFFAPMLWILAARAFDGAGRVDTAGALLEDVARFLPADDRFWALLADVRSRAQAAP